MKDYRPRINISKNLPNPSEYVLALDGEFKEYAFNEERSPEFKGKWREAVFKVDENAPLDVEIGTGNGYFFAHFAEKNPDRSYVGFELKYKPLIQSIRRALTAGSKNARICRYAAQNLDEVFADGEINNVYIHFPDPWTSPKKPHRRIVNKIFLERLHKLQRPGALVEFKTDSKDYFDWALEEIAQAPYEIVFQTFDLHKSERAHLNFVTSFERIFTKQGILTNYILLKRKN